MKLLEKVLISYLIVTLSIAGYFGYVNRDNLKHHIPLPVKIETKETLEEQRKYLDGSPFKIQLWISENIKGKSDSWVQFAQTPEETYERRTGDCEDYALLAKYFLETRYDEIHIVVWEGKYTEDSKYRKGKWLAHAICIFKIEDGWGIIDNNAFLMMKGTLEEAIRYDCKLRDVEVKRAFTVKFWHYAYRKLKKII